MPRLPRARPSETQNSESENRPADAPATRESIPRVSLPLGADGRVDWERMQSATREKLLVLLRADPKLRAAATSDGAAPPEIFNAAWCSMVFDALGQIEIAIAMRVYHCSQEQASVMLYTDSDKAMLSGPTAKVLNKYAGTMFVKYGDEVALAMLLGSTVLTKTQRLRAELSMAHPRADVLVGRGNPTRQSEMRRAPVAPPRSPSVTTQPPEKLDIEPIAPAHPSTVGPVLEPIGSDR